MLVQQPATPIHVLESQLAALQHTKADMYELREHMAGLEDELEQISIANNAMQRELDRKSELLERHSRRAEAQQERILKLGGEAGAAKDLQWELSEANKENAGLWERTSKAEQKLAAVGRSHELLVSTISGTAKRLLRPQASLDATRPLAWQDQLHAELAAVLAAPLVKQSSADIRGEQVASCDAAAPCAVDDLPTPLVGGHVDVATAAWWLSTANELRVERGQLASQLEQRRREQRVECVLLSEELAACEEQWPGAAFALRRCLQPILIDIEELPVAARREASTAGEEAAKASQRNQSYELARASAASESSRVQLRQARSSAASLAGRLAQSRARAEQAGEAAAEMVRNAPALDRTLVAVRVESDKRAASLCQRTINALAARHGAQHDRALMLRTVVGWQLAMKQERVARLSLTNTSRRLRRSDVRRAFARWASGQSRCVLLRRTSLALLDRVRGRALRSWRAVLMRRSEKRIRLSALARSQASRRIVGLLLRWQREAAGASAFDMRWHMQREADALKWSVLTLRQEVCSHPSP